MAEIVEKREISSEMENDDQELDNCEDQSQNMPVDAEEENFNLVELMDSSGMNKSWNLSLEMSSNSEPTKRKHKTLSIADKCKILKRIDAGEPHKKLATEFGIGISTISDIKKSREKIFSFISLTEKEASTRKTLKTGEYSLVEAALYSWFLQERSQGKIVSPSTLQEKAKFFCSRMYSDKEDFKASDYWLYKFKKRYGIRCLSSSYDTLYSKDSVECFQNRFFQKIRNLELSPVQIYCIYESTLSGDNLPKVSFINKNKEQVNVKIKHDRLSFIACSNSDGSHRLKIFLVGKYHGEEVNENSIQTVIYKEQKNSWIERKLFEEWFQEDFVTSVKDHLKSKNLPEKAILVLDDGPPHSRELKSIDGNLTTLLLPQDLTTTIQAINNDVIQAIKFKYRTDLLFRVLAHRDHNGFKKCSLIDIAESIADAWNSVDVSVLKKPWNKLLPDKTNEINENGELNDKTNNVNSIVQEILEVSNCEDINKMEVEDFINGKYENKIEIQSDGEIIDSILESNGLVKGCFNKNQTPDKVKHKDASSAIDLCINWAAQNNINPDNISVLFSIKKNIDEALQKSNVNWKKY